MSHCVFCWKASSISSNNNKIIRVRMGKVSIFMSFVKTFIYHTSDMVKCHNINCDLPNYNPMSETFIVDWLFLIYCQRHFDYQICEIWCLLNQFVEFLRLQLKKFEWRPLSWWNQKLIAWHNWNKEINEHICLKF